MKPLNLSLPITKVDEELRTVWGYATVEELDKQGEIVSYEASKKAFSAWPGNIREMHDSNKAVGKKVEVKFDDANKGVWVGAYISRSADGENAWTKIKEGVLTGFSIGGKINDYEMETVKDASGERDAIKITDYDLAELSVVDNPAAPSATLQVVKSMGNELFEAEVLQRVNDPRSSEWWMKYYQISPSQLISKSDSSDNKNEMKSDVKKSMYEASWLLDLACQLASYINGQTYEGEDAGDLKTALQTIKDAIVNELNEPTEEVMLAVELASKVTNLKKEEGMAKEDKKVEKAEKAEIKKDMYNVRVQVGPDAQQSEDPSATTKEKAEENSADGKSAGNDGAGPMSEAMGDREGDSQSMYDVRDKNDDEAQAEVQADSQEKETAELSSGEDHTDEYVARPRVMSGGKPRLVNSVSAADIAKAVAAELRKSENVSADEMTKSEFGKVKTLLESLVDRVERLEAQPEQPKAVKGEFVEVAKAEEPTVPSELDALLEKAEKAATDTSMSLGERSELALAIAKARRAQN